MHVRAHTLYRVPVYCAVAGWLSFQATVHLGRFFLVVTPAKETTQIAVDPVRSAILQGALFVLVLLLGGLWAFRHMTRAEIAVSSGIASGLYLIVVLLQLFALGIMAPVSVVAAMLQNWPAFLASFLMQCTGQVAFSAVVASFAPLLFIPFGHKNMQ